MLATEREQIILNYLSSNQLATTGFLSELTGASIATVRRDLNSMSKKGLIAKTHGGAKRIEKETLAERLKNFMEYDPYINEKEQIAHIASDFVLPGDIIFIGAGTTCNLLTRYLKTKENITIVTTNLTAVIELINAPNISIIVLGGNVHIGTNHIETLDEDTVNALNKLYFDKVFFTVDGVDMTSGYSIINKSQLPLYNHLINNSKTLYLLADKSKFDKRTFTHLCGIDEFKNIITNPSTEPRYLEYYSSKGINCFTEQQ